jgi:hypothetical protein
VIGVEDFADLREARRKSKKMVRELSGLQVNTTLEAQLINELMEGRRTGPELVKLVFNVDRSNPEFHTYYMRVRRAISSLESKGYVVSRLFGRDKPYRLTRYAVEQLASLGGGRERLLPKHDLVLYFVTLAMGIISWLVFEEIVPLEGSVPYIYGSFLFLLGSTATRILMICRRLLM